MYAGKPLERSNSYAWKVRTWIGPVVSEWSATQGFKTSDFKSLIANGDRFSVSRYPLVQTAIAPREIVEIEKGHYFIDFWS